MQAKGGKCCKTMSHNGVTVVFCHEIVVTSTGLAGNQEIFCLGKYLLSPNGIRNSELVVSIQ